MASALASEIFGAKNFVKSYDHDPGATTAVITSPDGGTTKRVLDMSLYGGFAVQARPTIVGGTGLTTLEIVAADDEAMSANVTIVKTTTVAGDSLNDVVWLECLASEIRQLSDAAGYALRYVAARLTMGTNTDEANVTYIGFHPRFPRSGLTATAIT